MGQRWDLSSPATKANFDAYVGQAQLAGKRIVVEFISEKRSLDQNSMIYALYKQVAGQKQDESIQDITRHCKLHYGIGILKVSDPKFCAMYDKAFKNVLSYEEKLQAMDYLPVTRLFNVEQGTEYIDTIIREYSKQGLCLLHPSEVAA